MRPVSGCNPVSTHPLSLPLTPLQGWRRPWPLQILSQRESEAGSGSLELSVEASRREEEGKQRPGRRPCCECEWTTGLKSRKRCRPGRSRKSSYLNRGGQDAGAPPPLSRELTHSLQSSKSLVHSPLSIQTRSNFQYGSKASQGLSTA